MGGKATKVLKATNPFNKPKEHTQMVLDPGGLFHTSDNADVAEHQAKLDVGGIGSKKTLTKQAADAAEAETTAQGAEIARQAAEAASALESRRKRVMTGRQRGRGSLLSGSESGIATTSSLG